VDLLVGAALAVREGLPRDQALAALTTVPAEFFGVAKKLGTIRPGADADLVAWSGDPLTLTACVELVLVDGEIVYQRVAEKGDPTP
jgi:imidazolonepropionase-like amidohydrolase